MKESCDEVKISVIMPVYNMQEYIGEAIESWLGQTLDNMELICVDDCSTDNSGQIIRQYALQHNNIHICSLPSNSGVGAVRRKAMQLVRGKYIAFLDADDKYWRDDALEKLYNHAIDGNCDVCGGFVANFSGKEINPYGRFRQLFKENDGTEYVEVSYDDVQDDYFFQGFIYKKEYLERNHIEFPEWRNYEDPVFLVQALYHANKICAVDIEYYGHRHAHKELKYSLSELINILNGIKANLIFAESKGLEVLFGRTFHRLNKDFFQAILDSLKLGNEDIENSLLYLKRIGMRHGYSLDIIDYLLFLENRFNGYEDYKVYKKCKNALKDKTHIILYGAGNIGKRVYREVCQSQMCSVDIWVDAYRKGEIIYDVVIKDPESVKTYSKSTDCVLIGIDNAQISGEVRESLEKMGTKEIIEWINL